MFFLVSVSGVWLIGMGWVMKKIADYKKTPGVQATPSLSWPKESRLPRKAHQATLLLFVHPHCPCTRATLSELARLMTSLRGRLSACLVFIQPSSFSEDWAKTDLWIEARRIPDVQTLIDQDGQQAWYFRSSTSGQVLVYAADGRLLFNGGITPSRGHEGDNLGVRRIISLVKTGHADQAQSPVFGCPLQEGTLR
jgi:hypothetical protein